MSKKHPVSHFEMTYNDRERMSKFYESVFGWETVYLGEEMGGYVYVTTTETIDRVPKRYGTVNGGFYPNENDWVAQPPTFVIEVDDIRALMQHVAKAGGRVMGEPFVLPGIGEYVSFFDTEGNRVSMIQLFPGY